jgi:diacylglycerol kinase family enzyme
MSDLAGAIVVNPKSGGVGPKAAAEAERVLSRFACEANVVEAEPPRVEAAIEAALALEPDVVVVLAGDGTARTAACLAGPGGPLIAPLPGGTMNLLPKALYGTGDWKLALERALTLGTARCVPGGEVEGSPFYVAAVLGSPALWAPARESLREGKLRLAWLYARRATRRAFRGRIRFQLDDFEFQRGQALALLTPLISRALTEPSGLEAAVLNPNNAAEAFRLAARTLYADWRADPAVATRETRLVHAWARAPIPAILDGEPVHLGREVEVRFAPVAFRALAPARDVSSTTGAA